MQSLSLVIASASHTHLVSIKNEERDEREKEKYSSRKATNAGQNRINRINNRQGKATAAEASIKEAVFLIKRVRGGREREKRQEREGER